MFNYNELLFDLYNAFYDAKRNKANRNYILAFEKELSTNLKALCNEIWEKDYKARPSTCFVITDPKQREVFAADFRDRIVHHLYYNYAHNFFEKTFISDSYSCIKNKGTFFGIDRLEHHIKSESNNYSKKCYILKLDIRGYFMNINKQILLKEVLETIDNFSENFDEKKLEIIRYLTKEIILLDPTNNCIIKGKRSNWNGLSKDKSLLLNDNKNKGLPIGNLTSQLFSNVYLNVFDQWMKREMHCKHYGRYVDDSYVVSSDRIFLLELIPKVESFLKNRLDLILHRGKTRICNSKYGVEFLGAYLKPYRRYISNQCLNRMKNKIKNEEKFNISNKKRLASKISRAGILTHYKSYNIKKKLFFNINN